MELWELVLIDKNIFLKVTDYNLGAFALLYGNNNNIAISEWYEKEHS